MSTTRPAVEAAPTPRRRTVLKATAAGAITVAAPGSPDARAATHEHVITRPIPRSSRNERVPVIGLGSFMTFDRVAPADRGFIPAVIDRFWRGGGRVIDTSALYGSSEANVGEFAHQLGLTDELFVTNKSWNCGEYAFDPSYTLRQFARSQDALRRKQLDVVGIHSMTNVGMMLPVLRQLNAEGKVRYLGLTSHEPYQYAGMVPLIKSGAVDFIQIRYSIHQRVAEDGLLALAADHGVAVMVNCALEKDRLHHVVGRRPLPRFAAEFGCESWAEFFLKYVVAHPAVTCVIPATTNPEHVAENLGAMRGDLPDRATRQRNGEAPEGHPGLRPARFRPVVPGQDVHRRSGQAASPSPSRLTGSYRVVFATR